MSIAELDPRPLWKHFVDLNTHPRPSKQEQAAAEFVHRFGIGLGLQTEMDEVGNVIIRKPATQGMESRRTVVLQGHVDMVCQKNEGTDHDFTSEGIRMLLDDGWVRADGTTLGADNGIGVAAAMAILESNDISHPAIEALFTIDEETGMTGAQALQPGQLTGEILLNLDTEEETELTIGCAGGVDVTATMTVPMIDAGPEHGLEIRLRGLSGGHSGMDIHLGRGNANKLMNRLLMAVSGLQLARLDGGSLRNAIPRESTAEVRVADASLAREKLEEAFAVLKIEYSTTDPDLRLEIADIDTPVRALDPEFQSRLLAAIAACPNGIHRMSPEIPDLVQTSNNLARVEVKDGHMIVQCLTRSAVDSEKMAHAAEIEGVFSLLGAAVEFAGTYPGWAPKPEASIVKLMEDLYEKRFGDRPTVAACHAGLECGIIGRHYPQMEMISFGPNIRGAHSPDEKVQVDSVERFWGLLLQTLEQIPERTA
jgi:dipeptidase D